MREIVVMMSAFVLVACVNKNAKTETSENEDQTETMAQKTYASPDRAMYRLKGEVSSAAITYYSCDEQGNYNEDDCYTHSVTFATDGTLQADEDIYYDASTCSVKRDTEGRIGSMNVTAGYEGGMEYTYDFIYNGELLTGETVEFYGEFSGNFKTEYTYDESGNLIKVVSSGISDSIVFTNTETFTIQETDENGNWTKCLRKTVSEEDEAGENGTYTTYHVLIRNIKYY